MAGVAAFSAAIALQVNVNKVIHPTGVTIYSTPAASSAIATAVDAFPSLWKDTGNVINVPESEEIEILLLENWRELYKPGQARVYPLGDRDKEVIDREFDKLYD